MDAIERLRPASGERRRAATAPRWPVQSRESAPSCRQELTVSAATRHCRDAIVIVSLYHIATIEVNVHPGFSLLRSAVDLV